MESKTPEPHVFAVVPVGPADRHRYLQAVLEHLHAFVENTYVVYDYNAKLLQHEGRFRTELLINAVHELQPRDGIDWILVNDADEFLVTTTSEPMSSLMPVILREANDYGADSLVFGLDELWQLDPPKVRVDKAWADQRMLRMFRYQADKPLGVKDAPMASGSIPPWAQSNCRSYMQLVRVVHASYADPDDRLRKYLRYKDRTGHSSAHVESILDESPTLEDISFELPAIRRGAYT